MKVMIVDDEQDVQFLFQQQFRKELKAGKIEFCFAFSAKEALQYLETQGITDLVLILSDINMPGMNGLELLKHIKEKYPSLRVFMITAYSEESNHQQAVAFGCDDYITKPIDFDMLKSKIFV
ncbi:MAG: response regulator [bacterium]